MAADTWRVFLAAVAGLALGLPLGWPFLGLSVGLVLAGAWYYRTLRRCLESIRRGSDDGQPDAPGIINDLIREFDQTRAYQQRREGRLAEFLHRFQHAAAALPDAVLVTLEDGTIEWVNARAVEYLGIGWPQDRGQRLANLIRDPALPDFLAQAGTEGHPETLELVSPASEGLRLELRRSAFGDGRVLIVARDITAMHRSNQIRKDFIANASHELRTPLTVISGYLESLDHENDADPSAGSGIVAKMRDQAGRMQRLIDDLLTLSTLESSDEYADGDEIQVAELLASVCNEARAISGARGHTFLLDADRELILRGSQRQIYSAFSNLVCNAVQYTPDGGEIRVAWHADNGGATMSVTDTGEGIAPEHIPRLTERFYRVDKGRSRDKGGTGLGLAIVKHVLARHNASLTIRSRLEKGSTFSCHFPPARISSAPSGEKTLSRSA